MKLCRECQTEKPLDEFSNKDRTGRKHPDCKVCRSAKRRNVKREAPRESWERVLFLPDIHAPFHDAVVWPQVVRFAKAYKPDRVVWMGDLLDAYTVSSFAKDPTRKLMLQEEVDSARELIAEMRAACPDARMDMVTGNHEQRVEKFLWSQAPALASLRCLRLAELLGLDGFGITLHGRDGFLLRPKFRVKHGDAVRRHSGHSAKAEFEKHGVSGVSGHTHRVGSYELRNDAGSFAWWELGCLCNLDAEYISGVANWQQAIAVGEFVRRGNRYSLDVVRIPERRLVYQGVDYSV